MTDRGRASSAQGTQSRSLTHSIPVDPELGCKRVVLEMSVPSIADAGGAIGFAEHVLCGGQATDTVIACAKGAVIVSEDLGESWERIETPELSEVAFRNSFTTEDGTHLLQGAAAPDGSPASELGHAPIAVLDADWRLLACSDPAYSIWHGSRSIDEADGVIIYAEYPTNSARPPSDQAGSAPPRPAPLRDSRLLRSTDGGRSWEVVLQVSWREIRHFHTVVADPWRAGRWWASSGDGPHQCRIWESLDHGLSWQEAAVEPPAGELHPSLGAQGARSALRHTDVAVRETDLIWGADDLLGEWLLDDPEVPAGRRAGARLFRSGKEPPWRPISLGRVGDAVRSLVDVGPAYLVATQAKGALGYRPRAFLLWKQEPMPLTPLFTVDNFRDGPAATGFTYSCASRAAKDGVFFTRRSSTDAFAGGPALLRWRVSFD